MKRGESRDKFMSKHLASDSIERYMLRLPGIVPKTQAIYSPSFNEVRAPKQTHILRFDRTSDRGLHPIDPSYPPKINTIYYKPYKTPDYYDSKKVQKGLSMTSSQRRAGGQLSISKMKARDMSMYRQTEALQNIENENERFRMLQSMLSML